MSDLPEIEAVERLNLGPDERLAVYINDEDIEPEKARRLVEHVAKWADIAPDRVAVFMNGIELAVITVIPTPSSTNTIVMNIPYPTDQVLEP